MRPSVSTSFEAAISKPRLDSYKGYFKTRTMEESIGLYMWNMELSSCYSNLISLFEIALRNHIHRAMSLRYSPTGAASFHWYDKIWGSMPYESQNKVDSIRYTGRGPTRVRRSPAPSPDEIVSRVTFGFWPAILSIIDGRANYADKIFPVIFPNHPLSASPADWVVKTHRKKAVAYVYELNAVRNRIAHHEPLWKFPAVPNEVAESKNIADSLMRFHRLLSQIDQAAQAMNADLYNDMLRSSWRLKINYLLSERGILRYRTSNFCPGENVITPLDLQRNFHLIFLKNQPVTVEHKGRAGLFYPNF